MKCHRLLNPVKGHFSQSCSLLSPTPPFHSPLPVSFIFPPIPLSFLMCNISRRSGEWEDDEEEGLFRSGMGGWGEDRAAKTPVKITFSCKKSRGWKCTFSDCFASNGKMHILDIVQVKNCKKKKNKQNKTWFIWSQSPQVVHVLDMEVLQIMHNLIECRASVYE